MEIMKSGLIVFGLILLTTFSQAQTSQDYKSLMQAFQSSYTLENTGEYKQALDVLKAVYDEKSYELNLRIGWLNYLSGMFVESQAFYQKAMRLKPYAIEARLGYVYPLTALGYWDQIKKQYTEILEIDPLNTLANYRYGQLLYGKGDYAGALKHFEKVVNLFPFDYDGMIMYAWTNLKLGKSREAEILFYKTLLIRPNDTSALDGLKMLKP